MDEAGKPVNISFADVLFFTYAGDTFALAAAGGVSDYVTLSLGLYDVVECLLPKNTA